MPLSWLLHVACQSNLYCLPADTITSHAQLPPPRRKRRRKSRNEMEEINRSRRRSCSSAGTERTAARTGHRVPRPSQAVHPSNTSSNKPKPIVKGPVRPRRVLRSDDVYHIDAPIVPLATPNRRWTRDFVALDVVNRKKRGEGSLEPITRL